MIRDFEQTSPKIPSSCYVDPQATVIGDVVLGENCSVWPMSVIRGDVNSIRLGDDSNIQDNAVLHVSHVGEFNSKGAALTIGNRVTVGHSAVLHGCRIDDSCLIGMGAIIMDDAIVENQVMIGASTLVPPGKILESGHLYLGNPCRKARALTPRELEYLDYSAKHYCRLIQRYRG
jgi:carbonic anhydrase/acetyltransferase-like protein (isoleucine patch superfamily)